MQDQANPEGGPSSPKQRAVRERVERGIYRRRTAAGQTRYEIAYLDSDGKQRWKTEATLRDARLRRAELVTRIGRGERVAPSNVSVAAFADSWLARQESRLRPTTHTLYATYLRLHVKPRLGHRRLQSVTVDDVASLIGEMQRGVRYVERDDRVVPVTGKPFAPWTIRGVLVVLGRVFGAAVRDGTIPANPVRRLEKGERPQVERRGFPELDREAIGLLIGATPPRYRALVAVSVLTGLRQGEALGLRWDDVDVKAGVLRVRRQLDRRGELVEPKTTAAKRDVPIPPSLSRMLAAHRLASLHSAGSDFVFASERGGPMHHRNIVRRGLEKALAMAQLPHLSWHDLRHVAASYLIAEGASVAYLSRLLGHATPAITLSTYAHVYARVEHDDRTRDQMEAAFGDVLATRKPS